jgi:hypothetical protein
MYLILLGQLSHHHRLALRGRELQAFLHHVLRRIQVMSTVICMLVDKYSDMHIQIIRQLRRVSRQINIHKAMCMHACATLGPHRAEFLPAELDYAHGHDSNDVGAVSRDLRASARTLRTEMLCMVTHSDERRLSEINPQRYAHACADIHT